MGLDSDDASLTHSSLIAPEKFKETEVPIAHLQSDAWHFGCHTVQCEQDLKKESSVLS